MIKKEIKKILKRDHLSEIKKAKKILEKVLNKTKLIHSNYFSERTEANVFLKPEVLQRTGSFKIRGAFNKMKSLSKEELKKGVVCASAGNHAAGVAFSAKHLGIRAVVVMPGITPLLKVQSVRDLGGEVILFGENYDEAYKKAKEISAENDLKFIHPFDDYSVLIGQGTIGAEILEEKKDIDEIFIQIGGGGLLAGVLLATKLFNPKVKIIGVCPEGADSMKRSLEKNAVTSLSKLKTSAEGVAVKKPGELPFEIVRKYVDEIITVSEKEIMEIVLLVMEKHKLVVETAGAVSLAGLLKRNVKGKNICVLLSGGNIDTVTIADIVNKGMIERGRIMRFSAELPDRPGELLSIAKLLTEEDANVIELEHNQFKASDRYSNKVVLEVTVETNGKEHIKNILKRLEKESYKIKRIY